MRKNNDHQNSQSSCPSDDEIKRLHSGMIVENGIVKSYRAKMAKPSKEWLDEYRKTKNQGNN